MQLAVRWNRCDEVVEDHLKSPQTGLGGSRFQQSSRGSPDKRLGMFGKTGFDINEKPNIKELVTQVGASQHLCHRALREEAGNWC